MNKNRRLMKLMIGGLTGLLVALSVFIYITSEDEEETWNKVNQLRVESHSWYEELQRQYSMSQPPIIDMELPSDLSAVVINLEGYIVFSTETSEFNTEESISHLDTLFYVDESYEKAFPLQYKITLPLYLNQQIHGFVVFTKEFKDVKSNLLVENPLYIGFVINVLILVSLLWWYGFKSKEKEVEQLVWGLNQLSRQTFHKLPVPKAEEYEELFIAYNQLVDELQYVIEQNKLEEDNRKTFINKISHELKTPIATIKAYIEGLKNNIAKDEEKRQQYITIINNKMNQLMKVIDDFFVYTQNEGNRLKYHFKECYADHVIQRIFETISQSSDYKVIVENKLPKCIFSVDENRIEQVVNNLYNNARKHSKPNHQIKLLSFREDDYVVIHVEDEGTGIPPGELPHIFDSYYQGTASKKEDYQGIGLGLSICKSIVEAHQGYIKVKSLYGVGTTLLVYLPIV